MRVLYPTHGDYSFDPYEYYTENSMVVDTTMHIRPSEVLGPDGEPMMVGCKKPKVGFVLKKG